MYAQKQILIQKYVKKNVKIKNVTPNKKRKYNKRLKKLNLFKSTKIKYSQNK